MPTSGSPTRYNPPPPTKALSCGVRTCRVVVIVVLSSSCLLLTAVVRSLDAIVGLGCVDSCYGLLGGYDGGYDCP